MIFNYKKLISKQRVKASSIKRNAAIDDFYSDRSRIIYCSSFRRLVQKAQVFSLEPNASVRTRLTHSLEVSDLGRSLANKIAYKLANQSYLSDRNIPAFVAIVENACLLHDIGNPPFGHFGETAIRDWAENCACEALPQNLGTKWNDPTLQMLMSDFREFDGNPQGFRTITKLHTERDQYGLNLTYATLLCALKYSRAAGEQKGSGILKKAGYFQTEKALVENMYTELELVLHHRYPLTYIMEAADDIAYCMSDIADGIEKHILSISDFIALFKEEWENNYPDLAIPVKIPKSENCNFNHDISIPWSRAAMNEAVSNYLSNHNDVYNGSAESLITEKSDIGKVLETIKKVSRKKLYTSFEAESIELTGYAVISGILKRYERILKLTYDDFEKIVFSQNVKGLDIERRLFNRIGHRYVEAYKFAVNDLDKSNTSDYIIKEWWLRIHLIIDHISGMTDEFALQTYQMLEGINLLRQ